MIYLNEDSTCNQIWTQTEYEDNCDDYPSLDGGFWMPEARAEKEKKNKHISTER